MRSKFAVVVLAIAALLAGALVFSGCGGDDEDSGSTGTEGQAASAEIKPGTTVKLWIMPNGPAPKEDMEEALEPFTAETGIKVDVEVVDWDVQLDRIRNAAVSGEGPDVTQAGTTQVPFFAALGGFEDLSGRAADIGGESAYADGVWKTTQVVGQDGTWAVPWFTEARVDLLPQGRAREGRRRRGDRVRRLGLVPRDAAGDQGRGIRTSRRSARPARRRSTSSTT